MKMMIIALVVAASAVAQARIGQENEGVHFGTYNPEAIYKALNVQAVALNPGIAGISRREKSVGGLSCIESLLIVPNAKKTYACSIDQSAEDFRAIYKALKVEEEVLNAGIAGSSRTRKYVGGLLCMSSTIIYPNAKPSYSCEIIGN